MRIKDLVLPCTAILLTVIILYATVQNISEKRTSTISDTRPILLIDPGHGGPDGGASSVYGAAEDDINLSISLTLRDLLTLCGYRVEMTRTEDTAIVHADDVANSWKVNDMHNRLEMYNASDLTVSIHQNQFSQEKYHGAQLFYSSNRAESREVALCVQQQIVSLLQPENRREIKAAGENIFLLHNTKKPAVIVECGFLSNKEEAALLQDTQYQQQMAFAICCGILQYAPWNG